MADVALAQNIAKRVKTVVDAPIVDPAGYAAYVHLEVLKRSPHLSKKGKWLKTKKIL